MVRTGAHGTLKYGEESSFGGGATATRPFGLQQSVGSLSFKNNQIALTQLNSIEVQSFAYGKNEGSGSVDFVLSSPWVFDAILGGVDTSGSSSDYSHIWDSDSTNLTADNTGIKVPKSFDIEVGFASLQFPDGSGNVIAEVQDFDISFSSNTELLYEQGSASAVGAFRKLFEMTGKFNASFIDKAQLQKVFNRTELATLTAIFTNGLTGTSEKSIKIEFAGIGLSEHSLSIAPNEPIFEDLTFQMRNVKVTAGNSISAVP